MNERIQRLEASLQQDRERLEKLQVRIKEKEVQLNEARNTELLNRLNVLKVKGLDIDAVLAAIQAQDIDALMLLLAQAETEEIEETGGEIKDEQTI